MGIDRRSVSGQFGNKRAATTLWGPMDIQDLKIFSRAAAVRNLSAVGVEFRLTPGTISKRLQALEDQLGVRLFDRTTRSMRITQEGEHFLSYVERCLKEIADAETAVQQATSTAKGSLRIAGPSRIGRLDFASVLTDFLLAHPEIDIQADLTERQVNLQEEGYDVAIVRGLLRDSAMKARRLMSDEMVIVAAPSFLDQHRGLKRPQDLENHRCLVHGEEWDWPFAKRGKTLTVRVEAALRSTDVTALQTAARAGVGVARLPFHHVTEDLDSGRLVELFAEFDTSVGRAIWLVYTSSRHVPPRLRAFVDHVVASVRQSGLQSVDAPIVRDTDETHADLRAETERAIAEAERALHADNDAEDASDSDGARSVTAKPSRRLNGSGKHTASASSSAATAPVAAKPSKTRQKRKPASRKSATGSNSRSQAMDA